MEKSILTSLFSKDSFVFHYLPASWSAVSWSDVLSTRWWFAYLVKTYEADPYHVVIEAMLIVLVIWLLFRSSYDPKKKEVLTEKVEL